MIVAGIIGAGLVWGWLLVLFVDQRPVRERSAQTGEAEGASSSVVRWFKAFLEKWQTERRPYLNLLATAIFTIWFAWLIYSFTSAALLIPFFTALIIAFSVHFAWRQQLRRTQSRSS